MPFVEFSTLSAELQQEVAETYKDSAIGPDRFADFEFYVRVDGHMSRNRGMHRLTEVAYQNIREWMNETSSNKSATENWKPGTTFHVSRD